jgi:hypothetical protein
MAHPRKFRVGRLYHVEFYGNSIAASVNWAELIIEITAIDKDLPFVFDFLILASSDTPIGTHKIPWVIDSAPEFTISSHSKLHLSEKAKLIFYRRLAFEKVKEIPPTLLPLYLHWNWHSQRFYKKLKGV